jgi:transposase-like protein
MSNTLDLTTFFQKFPDEMACRQYLEQKLWKNGCVCPHCKCDKTYRYKDGKLHKCSGCLKQFQVTTNTIYAQSNLPLQKWFLAFYLIATHKKGISSIQLSKALGITQKSAWYLAHKIRYMLLHNTVMKPLKDIVECDETYVGGKMRGKRGRGSTNKTPVFGMLQRGGNLIIMPVENAKRVTIEPLIYKHVKIGTKIMTDEWWAYTKLSRSYKHEVVQHGVKEYVRGNVHVNSLEGAWSLLKRSIRGIYHRPSKKHLAKYCAEFQFKYNTRKDSEQIRFDKLLSKSKGKIKPAQIRA